MDDQNKNLILATALSFLVILVWFLLFPPERPAPTAPEGSVATAPQDAPQTGTGTGTAPTPPALDGSTPGPAVTQAEAPRISIDTPELKGSISLTGGRIDDLLLKSYKETLEPDSGLVRLLSPVGDQNAYYALYGWAPGGDLSFDAVPGANTLWEIESGNVLTPETPVTLRWDNGQGLVFHRKIAIDKNYLFTVTQSVENNSGAEQRLAPYGIVARHGEPGGQKFFVLHEGVVRMSDGQLQEIKYRNMADLEFSEREGAAVDILDVTDDGWVGFTDKYWMTSLLPAPGQAFTSVAKYVEANDIYQTETRLPTVTVAAGASAEVQTYLFAGAKEWETIRDYQRNMGFDRFVDSIDWGWFFFLTKPIFWVLHHLHQLIGNMGVSIIVLTLLIKALMFPLAYKSYSSMAKMKELQPEMEKLKERAGDDRQKLQAEMMALYKKEKVNPAAGCLPILLQIPVFFSLYKVVFVTIELRHAPFFGWLQDLSAPDPTSWINLFGLLPFAAPAHDSMLGIISIGVLPILLGISMYLQQKLNPAPADKTQAMVFAWMPWIFMFMLGSFASGLVLYWIANNTITFTQQYAIMRRHGYKPDVFGNILSPFRRKKPAAK